MAKNTLSIPDDVVQAMTSTEKAYSLPPGLLYQVMMKESSGGERFFNPETHHHYPAGPDGVRRTKEGKPATAFGLFGITEPTARDPGYGVTPMRDKTIPEQVRFAGEYLSALIGRNKGLEGGLDRYGTGPGYGSSILAKLGIKSDPGSTVGQRPVDVAAAPASAAGAPSTGSGTEGFPMQTVEVTGKPLGPLMVSEAPPTSANLPMADDNPWRVYMNKVRSEQAAMKAATAHAMQSPEQMALAQRGTGFFGEMNLNVPDYTKALQRIDVDGGVGSRPGVVEGFQAFNRPRRA